MIRFRKLASLSVLAALVLSTALAAHAADSRAKASHEWFQKGFELEKEKRYQEAIAAYTESIAIDPRHGSAYHNRGVSRFHLGQFEQALRDFDKAIELKPGSGSAYYARAMTNRKLGRGAQYETDLKRSAELGYDKAQERLAKQGHSAGAGDGNIAVREAGTIDSYQGHAVQAYHAETVKPYEAGTIQPYQAEAVKPYQAETSKPAGAGHTVKDQPATPSRVDHASDSRSSQPKARPAPAEKKNTPVSPASFLGTWYGRTYAMGWGYTTIGGLEVRPDGTYTYNTNGNGKYRTDGNTIIFLSGPLTSWNNGRAVLTKDNAIEFYWKNDAGAQQWFTFIK